MPTKKKISKAKASVELPKPTAPAYGVTYATTKAVSAEDAMEHIGRGWVLTQHDGDKIVVACPSDVYEEEN